MENENLRNIENLLAAKASTQPLYEFPVDQLPLGLRDSLSGVAAEARVPAPSQPSLLPQPMLTV